MSNLAWAGNFGIGDDDDENDDESYEYKQFGTKDGVILLIDASTSMFELREEEDEEDDEPCSDFETCLRCVRNIIQSKIISSEKDLQAIVFFNTDKHKNPAEFKNVYIFQELAQPGRQSVLDIEEILEGENHGDFETRFGHADTCSISDALWTCSNMFSACTQKLATKRLYLFTHNDNPLPGNQQHKRQAAAKAEDLRQNGIDITLLSFSKPDTVFDGDIFYKEVLYPGPEDELPNPTKVLEEFEDRVKAKDFKKRAITHLPVSLGKGLDFSVGVYCLQRFCPLPTKVKLAKSDNAELKSQNKVFVEETSEILMPQDMKKSQTYSGRKINFEPEEVKEMRMFGPPGFKLMGFKSRSCLKLKHHIKPAQFIYPDESNIEGSTTVFSALLKKCLDRNVVPICRYIARRNTPPRFVALLPQEEVLEDREDDTKVQQTPPGFHVVFLPYADDIRKVNFEENLPTATADQVNKAKDIVKALRFQYKPNSLENPALQHYYSNLEAMALDRDKPEEITDQTLPNDALMVKRAGKHIQEFKDLVFPAGYTAGPKRKAPGAAGGPAKKPKPEPTDINIEQEAKAGRLEKLTVAALRECAKNLKLPGTGKKADLIDAINECFGIY